MAGVPASSQHRVMRYVLRSNRQGGRGDPVVQRYRVGESHPHCTIAEAVVERLRAYQASGVGWRKAWLLLYTEGVQIGYYTVREIYRGRMRRKEDANGHT